MSTTAKRIRATYRQGRIEPQEPLVLKEGEELNVVIEPIDKAGAGRQEQWKRFNKGAEQVLQRLSTEVGTTSDSVALLRTIRNERASR